MENDVATAQRKVLAQKLRRLRTSQGLSLRQLGLMAGMDYRHVNRIELGELSPRVDTLARLADALGVHARDLL